MAPDPDRTDVLGERIGAQILDNICAYIVAAVVVSAAMVVWAASTPDLSIAGAVFVSLMLVVPIGQAVLLLPYSIAFEAFWNGQTPGKRLLGIRVVGGDGRPPTLVAAILRNIPAIAIFSVFQHLVATVAISSSDRGQRLFDRIASTYVVEAA